MTEISTTVCRLIHQCTHVPFEAIVWSADLERDLRLDCEEIVRVVVELEDHLCILIPDADLDRFQTVGELIVCVEKCLASRHGPVKQLLFR